ncbi:MAG: Lrp/AsnC family transcriptional regulator [Armatimonadota bacterium]|nr:Lrp/AsnC family transcriptional regulator [bacterium]
MIINNLIDTIDARLLELIQRDFPLAHRPFDEIAARLSISSIDAISRTSRLKSQGIIRQISAIFNSSALGYSSVLVAFRVGDGYLENVAAAVCANPGVSHCYSRSDDFNLWFTLTLSPESDLGREIAGLASLDGVQSHMILPALKVYKIGLFLKLTDDAIGPVSWTITQPTRHELTNLDRAVVLALQQDIPIIEEPFARIADHAGLQEDIVFQRANAYKADGTMRRFAAVLRHGQAGYKANAMVCWQVDSEKIDEVGEQFAQNPHVSHCYERAQYPNWPYSLYTMVHCLDDQELDQIIYKLAEICGGCDHRVLKTVKEYKKTRVVYFR